MAIKIDKLDEWVDYIPDVLGQRGDDNPVTLRMRLLRGGELRRVQSVLTRVAGKRGAKADERAKELVAGVVADNVDTVSNYTDEDREITTGAELAQHGLESIILDAFHAILDKSKLSEGLKKKWCLPCDSHTEEGVP